MIRCMIIDDESPARTLIQKYLSELPDFELVSVLDNAMNGFFFLQSEDVDLLFLDIQMPGMTGLELLKSLQKKPKVIITTAYREFAVDGFDLDAIDYLVKPISRDRFLRSISKFFHFNDVKLKEESPLENYQQMHIFVKSGNTHIKVFLSKINYIEGLKDYIKIHTEDEMHIAYERLGYMEAKLPENKFVRVHKSFIIALDKIASYNHECIKIDTVKIPIGRVYKQKFMAEIGKKT